MMASHKPADLDLYCIQSVRGSRGRTGARTHLKNHKIVFLSNTNTGPDPLKNHKATKAALNGVLLAGR